MSLDQRGAAEARLLHVERGLEQLLRDARNNQRRLIALGQGIWAEWGEIATAAASAATTTVTGAPVTGCSGSAISGLTVTIANHATSAVLASGTTDGSGNFTITFSLSGSLNIDVIVSGSGWTSGTVNTTISAGATFATGGISLSPSSSFVCGYTCTNPIPTTLTLTDSIYGAVTLTYNVGAGAWQGCTTGPYPGLGVCPAGTTAVHYSLGNNPGSTAGLSLTWTTTVISLTACPLVGATCSTTTNRVSLLSAAVSCSGTTTWTIAGSPTSITPWPSGGTFTTTF